MKRGRFYTAGSSMFTAPSVSGDMNSSGAGATSVPLALSNSSCAHPSGNLPNTATKSLIYICFFFSTLSGKAKVISVLNHKGGVGKTTTTINLGGALRQKGYKVLLIDLDGQANLTESLGFSAELPQTIYGAMKGEYDLPIYEHKDGLSVVPSCLDLSAVETELINEAGRELILAHLIKGQKEKFDYILIDCPPSLSLLTLNALTASDRLIIPVQAQFLAMRGMAKLMQVVHKVQQRLNSDLSIAGVLITQYDGRKNLNKSVSELVQETFQGKVFSTHIRNAITLAEAPTQGQDIFHYAPKSAGAEDYEKVCNELLTEIK